MKDLLRKYADKLLRDRSAQGGRIGIAAQDDAVAKTGAADLSAMAAGILERLSCAGVVAAVPSLPFADMLVRRAPAGASRLVPADTETRTFLHDIPFSRRGESGGDPAEEAAALLGNRKGIVLEGTGIVAMGLVTPEQAYVNYSCVFHATFVQYLVDVLRRGFLLPGKRKRSAASGRIGCGPHRRRVSPSGPALSRTGSRSAARSSRLGSTRSSGDSWIPSSAISPIRRTGPSDISQTAASLDELAGCIDPVPDDDGSTAGITASSELPAHRRIYGATGARAILHGHPKFAVAMSMICDETDCAVQDCRGDRPRVRMLGDTPVVGGEIGAGGLAESVARVIGASGKAIVSGHGVFAVGREGFEEAFRAMAEVESRCREEYFRRLDQSKSE